MCVELKVESHFLKASEYIFRNLNVMIMIISVATDRFLRMARLFKDMLTAPILEASLRLK